MRSENPPVIRLSEYRVPDFLIDHVALDFSLEPEATRVISTLSMRRNPEGLPGTTLELDGDDLSLTSVAIDGRKLAAEEFIASPDRLIIQGAPKSPGKAKAMGVA